MTVKVLIVDDSLTMRALIKSHLDQDSRFKVVGVAGDPYQARDLILSERPDILTLDVEMPRMDGVTFLERLIPQYPIPVLMISSLTTAGSEKTLRALSLGAVDFLPKPSAGRIGTPEFIELLKEKLIMGAKAKVRSFSSNNVIGSLNKSSKKFDHVVILGASTGGTEAIRSFLNNVKGEFPPVLITQHMPEKFTEMFAKRLDGESHLHVMEATDKSKFAKNEVHIAPGGKQMFLEQEGANIVLRCQVGNKVNNHMPSVDVLMNSAAALIGKKSVGVILTGMGADGAKGMLAMKKKGAYNFAQNEETCVVFGMPKVTIEIGAADEILSPDRMPDAIIDYIEREHE